MLYSEIRQNLHIAKELKPLPSKVKNLPFKIAIFRDPSLTLTVFHPGGLHKLAKIDFSMSCLSYAQKLEITKDLKSLACKYSFKNFEKYIFLEIIKITLII